MTRLYSAHVVITQIFETIKGTSPTVAPPTAAEVLGLLSLLLPCSVSGHPIGTTGTIPTAPPRSAVRSARARRLPFAQATYELRNVCLAGADETTCASRAVATLYKLRHDMHFLARITHPLQQPQQLIGPLLRRHFGPAYDDLWRHHTRMSQAVTHSEPRRPP